MAMIKCKECGNEISNKAEKCPHCGVKRQKQYGCLSSLLIIVLGVVFIGFISGKPTTTNTIQPSITPSAAPATPLTEKGKVIKAKHPSWRNEECNSVAEKKIHIGMTSEQVRAAWGKPYRINETSNKWGNNQQWVVHDSIDSDYLYFQNGVLTSIQQSK